MPLFLIAQGSYDYIFECPGCDSLHFLDSRWTIVNEDLLKPTVHPSVLVTTQGVCHFFIENGMIRYLADSTHKLAGQTVPMVNITA